MARLAPTKDTIRNLFARSGNVCAFPGCTAQLINEKGKFIAQICHIEAAEVGGERFNSNMSDEQRRHSDNLILFCYPHNVETDDVAQYSVETLKKMKLEHESQNGQKAYKINEEALFKVASETEKYWTMLEEHLALRNMEREYPIEMNMNDSFEDVLQKTKHLIEWTENRFQDWKTSDGKLVNDLNELCDKLGYDVSKIEELPYYDNPFCNRNWEVLHIGLHNIRTDFKLALCQLEIKYLEEFVKLNSRDLESNSRLEKLRETLKELISTQGYVD